MTIRKLTDRDNALIATILEVVAEELARGGRGSGALVEIKKELTDLWNEMDNHKLYEAMGRGWDRGKGWT